MNSIQLTSLDKIKVFFSSKLATFGLGGFAFGLFFLVAFSNIFNLGAVLFYVLESETISGEIVGIKRTNITYNEQKVYIAEYQFNINSKLHQGQEKYFSEDYDLGEEVKVEYLDSFGGMSRISGAKIDMLTMVGKLIVLLFPLIGLFFMISQLKRFNKTVRVLRDYQLVRGFFVRKEKTATHVNDYPMYKLTYQYSFTGKTFKPQYTTFSPDKFKEEEMLVICSRNPSDSILLKNLPVNVSRAIISKIKRE